MILPQLDQTPLYSATNFWLPVAAPANTTTIVTNLNVFICPSDQIAGSTLVANDGFGNTVDGSLPSSYACTGSDVPTLRPDCNNDGSGNGLFYRNSNIRIAAIIDGTSQTVMLLEPRWGDSEGTWTRAILGVTLRGPLNPCPGSAVATYLAPCLVQALPYDQHKRRQ